MSQPDSPQGPWEACPAGVLNATVESVRSRRRHQQIRKIASGLAVLVVMGALARFAIHVGNDPAHQKYGGLNCVETIALLNELFEKTLEPGMQKRVERHLADCPGCRDRYERMKAEQFANARHGLNALTVGNLVQREPSAPTPAI